VDAAYLVVLGIAQDAGYPQAGCRRECCARAWADPKKRRHVVCLAIVDPESCQRWLLECTPDLREVDVAYLDGTFYADDELPGRDMSKIPHPFLGESMKRFAVLPKSQRNKVRFLHLNHTNPVLDLQSREAKTVRDAGHHLAVEGERFEL